MTKTIEGMTFEENSIEHIVANLYRVESRRILATLIRLLGDFDAAEEAMHEAFTVAMEKWPRDGIPENPRSWLISTGRFKAIDALRRRARFDSSLSTLADQINTRSAEANDRLIDDDQLRLIFTCCHPVLQQEARVALTLREVCGLTTEEIARAFLNNTAAIAQRIVRAKTKIREAGVPFEIPPEADLAERLDAVLQVVYLVFNEGYFASSGETLIRPDLSSEAIRLGRLILSLLPESEAMGLLALMLLIEARRPARLSAEGDLILLEEQDRSLWNRELMREGLALVDQAIASRRTGPYVLQAAIVALHSQVPEASLTPWDEIAGLYDRLLALQPTPVVELNRAVAVAMHEGFAQGTQLIDAILNRGELSDYQPAYVARAELCRRSGDTAGARASYERALRLCRQASERRFLENRLKNLT